MLENTYNNTFKRPPFYLYDSKDGGMFLGVCKGISVHLQIPVKNVRIFFCIATFIFGIGIFSYIWFLIFIPKKPIETINSPERHNILSKPIIPINKIGVTYVSIAEYITYLIIFLMILYVAIIYDEDFALKVSILTSILGISIICYKTIKTYQENTFTYKMFFSAHYLIGMAIFLFSMFYLVSTQITVVGMHQTLIIMCITFLIILMFLFPVLVVLYKTISDSKIEKNIEEERANIAAHLHDGVLQTLILIQQNSKNSEEVNFLAKTQERDLRAWLYGDRPIQGSSISSMVKEKISQIEDSYRKHVELIVVGDCKPCDKVNNFIGALSEATINAIKHGADPISVYVEINANILEFFVRDRGQGFTMGMIDSRRLGVRKSIIKRIENVGGTVTIKNNNGCEVNVILPVGKR